ncbi:hypothetical protein EHI8A_054430 [Entamoeba histolytica HM-1:IMSS-B]|uniref:Uncharacterized protein n=6 Tax=Entamoeba histolytica TaxID=5759 RepID=B1N3S9_ENTH1|nr:hypothetical protein EHI_178000 [Entamoeba histolytica HM-1:IMSS]EMD49036.1 Hypothetical protein EHI5A_065220 [Entamoeba histolytica KU27]EMH74207.1 hypothetical protein EHI8A_054430 [Entamoeba histolytica HM-1:IMSS-B]EMS14825.1 hypothetical protein KM1_103310 [Entamoeba histolytica HM-3:IMSS]ENY62528.1 hypothetical protein EHI7A_053210 [Entamoeba histolytica HM-1:IMSS-A]GAT96533.1 hypothetical protein CL6EHI_178000 [Entamoeba histolytica]|eukprot:XP_001913845.1 hypothetical protein EHI_178000 [Entamoeba histolytica HM-1:IMSS]
MEYKVCFFGFEHSGVRSFIHRLISGNFSGNPVIFKEEYQSIEYKISKKVVKIKIWDNLTLEQKHKSINESFVKDSSAIIIVCDILQPNIAVKFKSLVTKVLLFKPNCKILIAFTKSDLLNSGIDIEIAELILEKKLDMVSVSSKTGDGISKVEEFIISQTQEGLNKKDISKKFSSSIKTRFTKEKNGFSRIRQLCKF